MAGYWIKLYHEILDDPKMATLPDDQWRKVIECFLIAGRVNNAGELPPTKQIAWILRKDESEVEEALNLVAKTGIIEKTDLGWYIPKFARRQEKISGSDRTRMSRERKQKQQYYCNDNVTQLKRNVTENRTDIDIEQIRTDVEAPLQANPNAYGIFENNIGTLTPMIADGIDNWIKTYPEEWIPAAIDEAVKNGARNYKYCDAILKRWAVDGFKSEKRPQSKPSNIEANFALANDLLREQNVNT